MLSYYDDQDSMNFVLHLRFATLPGVNMHPGSLKIDTYSEAAGYTAGEFHLLCRKP